MNTDVISFRRAFTLICAIALMLVASRSSHAASLLVDFSDSGTRVESDAAGFVYSNNSSSPQTRTYTTGSQGYIDGSMDLGSGVTVVLQTFNRTTDTLDPSVLRMIDRNSSAADLANDWATVEPGAGSGQVPTVGLQLNITGLASGHYDFSSLHRDTSNQVGVMDVQYSLDGGSTWVNLADNSSYGNFDLTIGLNFVGVDATDGLSLRYIAGGGLFGDNGHTTNTVNSNRLMPLNSFSITAVPTPAALPAGLGLLAIGAIRRRRA